MIKEITLFLKNSLASSKSTSYVSNNYAKERIGYIDLAKGICIILVIWGHCGLIEIPNFTALRLPLYFVLSGLFFKDYDFKTFSLKKINNILVPFIFWFLIFAIYYLISLRTILPDHYINIYYETHGNFIDPFSKYIYVTIRDINPPIWFLISLLWANLIFWILIRMFKNNNGGIFCSVVGLAFISYSCYLNDIRLSLWLDCSLSAIPFFFLGYYLKTKGFFNIEIELKTLIFLILGFSLVGYLIYIFGNYPRVVLDKNLFYGNPLLIYLNSISMIIGLLFLCRILKWLPIISYVGRYSIVLLCLHYPIMNILKKYCMKFFEYNIDNFVLFCLTLVICWFFIPICKNFIPQFIAQKPLFKSVNQKVDYNIVS